MPNLSDQIASDLIDRQTSALKAAEGLSQRLMKALSEAEDKIATLLRRRDLSRNTRSRTVALLNEIRQIMHGFSGDSYKMVRSEASAIAKLVTSRTAKDVNTLFKVDVFNPVLMANQLKAILDDRNLMGGRTLADFWDQAPDSFTNAYSAVVRDGLIRGSTPTELLRDVEESTALATSRAGVRALIRTSIMTVSNAARVAMYKDSGDVVKGMQWVSTLDGDTCEECMALDGCCWDLDNAPIDDAPEYPGETAHTNCRCTQIPLMKSFKELANDNPDLAAELDDSMDDETRASMDGQVAGDMNYEDWLNTKSEDFQRETLGDARFDLWSSGNMSLRDLVDHSGDPLTVEQLQRKFA